MKFVRVGINDPGINNIEAISFLVPQGWRTSGGIKWFPDYSILAVALVKVSDPATGAEIEYLPTQNFTWLTNAVVPMRPGTNYLGNIVCQPITGFPQLVQGLYAEQAAPQLRGMRPASQEDLPKIAQLVSANYGGQSQVKAQRLRYQYQRNGQPWTEELYLTAVYTNWQGGTLWSVTSAYSFRAPSAQFSRVQPMMAASVGSLRMSQDWYSGYMYVQKLFNDRMNQSIKNAKALSDTITRNSEEIRQMFADSYKQHNESQDRISQNWSEYIRGVNTYDNPFESRPVELPSGYDNAWVNARGEYMLTNQAGYDPNVGDTTEWRRMEQQRR